MVTVLLLMGAGSVSAQDWAGLGRYHDAAQALSARKCGPVVFMGNSITELWPMRHPDYFLSNGFICRGISGQTTPQMLIRFRDEVVNAGARTVVILAGTNDVAGNTGPATREMILDNIASMCDIALGNGIRPVLCSVLPAHAYGWKGGRDKHPEVEIPLLNEMLRDFAAKRHITYVDFFNEMVDDDPDNLNGLPARYSYDGVHPTLEGYLVMESILDKALSREKKEYRRGNGANLRLMSYNVRNCKGMDGNVNYRRVAAVISDCCPDVVAVQELDSCATRHDGKYVLGELARCTGLKATYAPAIDFQGGKYGVGILSREEPISVRTVPLPGREEERVLLVAEFEKFCFCCTHLSLTEKDRIASVDIIRRETAGADKPVFIAGDWNDTPDSEFLRLMGENFTLLGDVSAPTFPSDNPDRTIDFIAVSNGDAARCKVVDSYVPHSTLASDHRPVVCGILMREGRGR